MADIFISYSKVDHDLASSLAVMLEAEGWSVWWDARLDAGDPYRDEIRRELAEARAVIAVWTPTSIRSGWVMAEANRAEEDGKLIQVKSANLDYKDIPLPFGEMHTETLGNDHRILRAVRRQLLKPRTQSSWATSLRKRLRHELLWWGMALGTALTLVSNFNNIPQLAKLARDLVDGWGNLAVKFWRTVLFFTPPIAIGDALFLTILFFVICTIASSMTRPRARDYYDSGPTQSDSLPLTKILIVMSVLWAGIIHVRIRAADQEPGLWLSALYYLQTAINHGLRSIGLQDFVGFPLPLSRRPGRLILVPLQFIDFLLYLSTPVIVGIAFHALYSRATGLRVDMGLLNSRLDRIIVALTLLLALIIVGTFLERAPRISLLK